VVASSEAEHGHRNAALAHFLASYGNLENPVGRVLDHYVRHCAIAMSCAELALAGGFLARHGVRLDGSRLVARSDAKRINAVMLTCGTYDAAGEFAYRVGLPAKSGVAGGILAIIPGRCSLCVWSPGLDDKGNEADARHAAQRKLVTVLVDRLTGRSTVMYEVAAREMPRRSLLCLKRNVDEAGLWALGKEFIGIVRDQRLPRMKGREGAAFSIYWGQVSADSDGPVEWCKPVPDGEAEALAAQFPELTLRVEPAHREAYVDLGPGGQLDAAQWQLADEALRAWADEQGIDPEQLSLKPEDLGVRITYLASGPPSETSAPDCDFAVPFA
jgi:Glutaminase